MSGTIVLLSGSGLTTAINLAYNMAVARFLGPTGFGHATVVYTLLTLISAITLSFQIVTAKVVAQQETQKGKSAAYRDLHRAAWGCGIVVALLLFVFQKGIAGYLHLPGSDLVALLAIGAAFYVPLGSRRGYIQGAYGFRRLATNLVLEGVVRFGGSLTLILLGFGVRGVIAANAAAVAVAYFAAASKLAAPAPNPVHFMRAVREVLQGIVFFAGQVLINNCDIVLVKHFFESREAGLYAAIAMVGRVIFAFSSAVVNTMFPIVAGTSDEERKNTKVISTSLLLVLGIGSVLALALRVTPAVVWTVFFGSGFELDGKFGFPYLLALYAITTVIYSLSVVIITYEMSYKIANTSWVQLAFSGVLILGLCRYHSSLQQVILVQLILMSVLFVLVAIPFLIDLIVRSKNNLPRENYQSVRVMRHVSEDEVISEFLRTDFHSPVFADYRETLREIVINPNLDDARENAKRRALFFLRHRSLWNEIPQETEWYEVEVRKSCLHQIKVFPRAQWRKIARGNFSILEVAERLQTMQKESQGPFLDKIASISKSLTQRSNDMGAVILIGLNENEPLTILDGNHRFVSAVLATPDQMESLRFLCGMSPRMTECCWYKTNPATLFRYGKNLLRHIVRNPGKELARVLQSFG
ncbi:lipopolysaccharide biosynthesis protein [Acidobacterium sp. S8]|uniref:lipopolysaccharide biosynthesis protein n=1 Tax=Acidobacterium sp. S8 TaxID=1641854 RepID=UPI0020B11CA9|nr:oligosaccharide flippase family protein [Acidobacterium sp. S8]